MDLQEALRELGVDADPGDDTVRRAYLRQLKTRKPETDPEGFARLREAYETVLAIREGRAAPRTHAEPFVAPVQAAEPSDEGETDVDPEDVLERFRAEFRALPADAPPEAPVEVARRAVAALPDDEEPWLWLTRALIASKRIPEAAAALRAAYRRGHLVFLAVLVEQFPQELVIEDILVLAQHAPVPVLWSAAEQLLQVGVPVLAARCSLQAFGRMRERLAGAPPSTIWFARLVLGLHAQDRPDLAVEITRHCAAWLRVEVIAEGIGHPETATLWRRAEQLNALPGGFSPDLRALLANAALGGDLDPARAAYQQLLAQAPGKTRDAADLVCRQAPELASLLGLKMQPLHKLGSVLSEEVSLRTLKGWGLFLALVVPVVLQMHVLSGRTLPSFRTHERPVVTEARRVADAFCLQLPKEPQSLGCFQLRQLVDWATTNQCSRAHREWAALQGQLNARPAELERLKSHQGAFETSLLRLCPQ